MRNGLVKTAKRYALVVALSVMTMGAQANTGVGLFVGEPFWGLEFKHNDIRFNVSLDDQFGLGANKSFQVSNTPLYLFVGGQYIDRNTHYMAVTSGIGAELRVKPMGFYIDVGPNLYLDEMQFELEAKAGLRVYF
ncbi:hypothetical protein [uncultured Vibrio sp.]|uniref:hypothetical protein n=1 Tax=uncultured Vibrio sp. TaxID=114054 RepID=UPI0025FF6A55|nr:hypothetical protein [uncultured Vibrio sp.]